MPQMKTLEILARQLADEVEVVAVYSIFISGLIIALNHLVIFVRDRKIRPREYIRAVVAYGVAILFVFTTPLVVYLDLHPNAIFAVRLAASFGAIIAAIVSVRYTLWIDLLHSFSEWLKHGKNH